MPRVEINGRIVEFDHPPTEEDIDRAAADLSGGPGWGTTIAAGAARIGGPIAGGIIGSMATPVLGPLAPAGGAAIGGAAGEEVADWLEGTDDGYKDAALSAGFSALPGMGGARAIEAVGTTVARRMGIRAVEGGVQGGLQAGATAPIMEGRAPTVREVTTGVAAGTLLGGVFQGGAELYGKARGAYRAGAQIVDDLAGADAVARAKVTVDDLRARGIDVEAKFGAEAADDFGAEDALAREMVGPPEPPQPPRAPETRPPSIDPNTQEPVGPATEWGTPPRSPLRPYADGDATVPEAGPMSPERMDRASLARSGCAMRVAASSRWLDGKPSLRTSSSTRTFQSRRPRIRPSKSRRWRTSCA
jgi:hypothetical protein